MSGANDPTLQRIVQHLENSEGSSIDRFTLVRVGASGNPPSAAIQALDVLVARGSLRRVGDDYIRMPGSWPQPQGRQRSSA